MDLGLEGKKALISGATRGIGKAIALALAREGCSISFCAKNPAAIEQTLLEIREIQKPFASKALGKPLDVADSEGLDAWVHESGSLLEGLDIIIPNVSGFGTENKIESWHQNFNIDLLATIRMIDAALPFLKTSNYATNLIVSSNAAREVFDQIFTPGHLQPYGAIKSALAHYAKNISRALGTFNIRTNLISPGAIETENGGWKKHKTENTGQYQRFLKTCPLNRLGTPQEVAKAACFLVSPAASYINGANLVIDGGQTSSVHL